MYATLANPLAAEPTESTAAMAALATQSACYHCGLPLPQDVVRSVMIDSIERPMCCPGCEAVAQTIVDNGFADYYRTRSAFPAKADQALLVPPEFLLYDSSEQAQKFSAGAGSDNCEASLSVENIRCAACVWLIERRLAQLPGVLSAHMNIANERLYVRWNKDACKPSAIFQALKQLGYDAYPYDPARHGEQLRRDSRTLWRQLFVAGLSMMQVMMYAIPTYMGDGVDMEPDMAALMRWASLLLTIPAVVYSAQPFFRGAWINLKNRMLGMDVPIVLGIAAAFSASAIATWRGQGDVYFDTVTMFIFLLLCSRYFELSARRNAASAMQRLQHGLPASALRLADFPASRETELISASELKVGDCVLVKPGEAFASDGLILEGETSIDLSLLTGESQPQRIGKNDAMPGGAVNLSQAVVMRVTQPPSESTLSALFKLIERAGRAKPQLSLWADKAAAWFVACLLLFAVLVFAAWQFFDPSQAWPIAIAVLVVSCPCALSLATPTAVAAATDALTRQGVLIVKSHVLETMHRATHVIFDKTGTLTLGKPAVRRVKTFAGMRESECLRLAAALEASSAHPIAQAIVNAGAHAQADSSAVRVDSLNYAAGKGVEAVIGGRTYRLGSAAFVEELVDSAVPDEGVAGMTPVYFGIAGAWLARFDLDDSLRSDARDVVDFFRSAGKEVILLSGDRQSVAVHVASQLGIRQAHGEHLPDQKLAFVQRLQESGAVVLMIGDGINDAAVLHAADVSFAMGSGSTLAQVHADAVLLGERLSSLRDTAETARRSMSIIRQNLCWATFYNLTAIPAAALGLVNPWLCAVGMSFSSAVVVGNALRLRRSRRKAAGTFRQAESPPAFAAPMSSPKSS